MNTSHLPARTTRPFVLRPAMGLLLGATALGVPLRAATVYVDRLIGSTSCTTYDPAARNCSGGTQTAYRTIAAAAAAAGPGTIVIIREGTYAEQLRPASSGTAASIITFKNTGTEQVFLTGSPAINLSERNYIEIDGLRAENTTWLEAQNAHFNILRRCVFRFTPATGTTGNVRFVRSHNNQILENHIEGGQDNLLLIDSNFNLVQGNTVTEGRHSVFGIRCGDNNIIRGNYFANTRQKIGEVYDCGTGTSAVTNSFNSTKRNVIEGNVFAGAVRSGGDSTANGNGIQYSGQDGIIRRNVFTRTTAGVGMHVYDEEAEFNTNNRVYHNVFYANRGPGIAVYSGNVGNHYKNNIFLANAGCLGGCDAAISPGQVVYRGSLGQSAQFVNNSFLYQNPGQAVFEEEFGAGHTLAGAGARFPGVLIGNVEINPQFIDGPNSNFRLQAGSPAVDAGAFLTRTASAGSGTNMTVVDARYFMNGFGIAGEQGDLIQLQGQTQTARVTAVNYTTNVITLSQSLTWSGDQGVTLAYAGGAPDLGAFEREGAPNAPTNLTYEP